MGVRRFISGIVIFANLMHIEREKTFSHLSNTCSVCLCEVSGTEILPSVIQS